MKALIRLHNNGAGRLVGNSEILFLSLLLLLNEFYLFWEEGRERGRGLIGLFVLLKKIILNVRR